MGSRSLLSGANQSKRRCAMCRMSMALGLGMVLVVLAGGGTAIAASVWSGPAGGDWFTDGNWTPSGVPGDGAETGERGGSGGSDGQCHPRPEERDGRGPRTIRRRDGEGGGRRAAGDGVARASIKADCFHCGKDHCHFGQVDLAARGVLCRCETDFAGEPAWPGRLRLTV